MVEMHLTQPWVQIEKTSDPSLSPDSRGCHPIPTLQPAPRVRPHDSSTLVSSSAQ